MAVTAGNTFVLKPSEKDPGASIMLAELALQLAFQSKQAVEFTRTSQPCEPYTSSWQRQQMIVHNCSPVTVCSSKRYKQHYHCALAASSMSFAPPAAFIFKALLYQ